MPTSSWRRKLTTSGFGIWWVSSHGGALFSDRGWCQSNVGFWLNPNFYFQPNFRVFPALEVDVKSTLGFNANPDFHFRPNVSVFPTLGLTSAQCSPPTKFSVFPSLEVDLESKLGFDVNLVFASRQISKSLPTLKVDVESVSDLDFHLQPNLKIFPVLVVGVSPIFMSK